MIPIAITAAPFGLVMGTVCFASGLDTLQAVGMNFIVFAGSAQLAVLELMTQKSSSLVIILTGLIINLRFMLYSAAFAPYAEKSSLWIKTFCSFNLTDQSFAVMKANESQFKTNEQAVSFYLGAAVNVFITWQVSVIIGFIFGNFLPSSFALDYAIPLSFVALVLPSLKNRKYYYVAIASSILSILLKEMPYNLGLLTSTLLALSFAALLNRKKVGL